MPPPRTIRRRAPRLACTLAAAALAAGSACAARRPAAAVREPAEVLVEVLPRAADVSVDGAPLGAGARTVRLADDARHSFRATAPGFEPAERLEGGASLAGARVGLALRPVGYPGRVDLDDPPSLAGAAGALLAQGRPAESLEYARRAAEMSPRVAALRKLAARAAAAAGDRERAIAEYRAYLTLAPDAADRGEVASAMEALRVPPAAPGVEVRRGAPAAGGAP